MEAAADRVRIYDPYPHGHYRETTHTAMGTAMDGKLYGLDGGSASATCEVCHSRDLQKAHTDVPAVADSPYGTKVGCGECHNDVRARGEAEVLTKWKKRSCEACHATGSSAPMHDKTVATPVKGTGAFACGSSGAGCHDGDNLHALHAEAPKNCAGSAAKGEKSCHVAGVEAGKPTATSCGGPAADSCHRGDAKTGYTHTKGATAHSPHTSAPAKNTSYEGTPCGGCHRMAADGNSLVSEHALSTSAKTGSHPDNCRNCHGNLASAVAIADRWAKRDTAETCSTCHGVGQLPAAHEADLSAVHEAADSAGCAASGAGCHPTADLSLVGAPATGVHRDCLRCHDWRAANSDLAYDPTKKSCGEGRACHATAGAYDPATSVHAGATGLADGADAKHHVAGAAQADAVYIDEASGVSTPCRACHAMSLGAEHARASASGSTGAGTACARCHNASATTAAVVKASWAEKSSTRACSACHRPSGDGAPHAKIETSHMGIELAPDGNPAPGSCTKPGCHATPDLRQLHTRSGCTAQGCHSAQGDIFGRGLRSCGGLDAATGCHAGYSAGLHFANHSGASTGTVDGVAYRRGENVGCFGCHLEDLQAEHGRALRASTLDGGATTVCAICHVGASGGSSTASLPAVRAAIAGHDRRCVACHASGSSADGPSAVASAHHDISSATPLPAGKVWADPFGEWKAAFDAPTGSGHNSLSPDVVGGMTDKHFPLTEFSIGGARYTWALPATTGATAWLKASAFPAGSLDSTQAIQHISVSCDDCHVVPASATGPQGAAVSISIDPKYSQTEYANPTPAAVQFEAKGSERVICFKCHQLDVGGIEGSTKPGGAALHARHVKHLGFDPVTNPRYYGEKCVDCHVRIPHAWKRPRLLIRTVVTTDGASPDEYPYVRRGHDGLVGIRLRSFTSPTDLRSGSCATGGCHASTSPARHPRPSDIPTATYWP